MHIYLELSIWEIIFFKYESYNNMLSGYVNKHSFMKSRSQRLELRMSLIQVIGQLLGRVLTV